MFNIIENPQTKELFLSGYGQQVLSFDGTPFCINTEGWRVVSQAPCVDAWVTTPGEYRTLSMVAQICLIPTEKSKPETFTMGGTLSYITNWLTDAKARNYCAYIVSQRAYSCRNKARSLAEVEV